MNRRWRTYKRIKCEDQKKLYSSFLKHGVEKHVFEIITECSLDEMLQLETHWGLFYNVLDKNAGLNLRLPKDGEKYGGFSKDRNTTGDFKKGQIPWNKGIKGGTSWNKGIPCRDSTKGLLSKVKTGIPSKKKGVSYGSIPYNARLVLCLDTGFFFYSCQDAAIAYNYKRSTLQAMLTNKNPNRTNLIYV